MSVSFCARARLAETSKKIGNFARRSLITSVIYLPGRGQKPSLFFTSGSQFTAVKGADAGGSPATAEMGENEGLCSGGSFAEFSGNCGSRAWIVTAVACRALVGFPMLDADEATGAEMARPVADGKAKPTSGDSLFGGRATASGADDIGAGMTGLAVPPSGSLNGAIDGAVPEEASGRSRLEKRLIETTPAPVPSRPTRIRIVLARMWVDIRSVVSVVAVADSMARCRSRRRLGVRGVIGWLSLVRVVPKLAVRLEDDASTPHRNRNSSPASAMLLIRASGLRCAARANHASKPAGTWAKSEGIGMGSVQIASTRPPNVSDRNARQPVRHSNATIAKDQMSVR